MSVAQKWIIGGLIGSILLLLFPPFIYIRDAFQWHFFFYSQGRIDVLFLALELAILGMSVFTGYYLQTALGRREPDPPARTDPIRLREPPPDRGGQSARRG